jgi:hypothetical protein
MIYWDKISTKTSYPEVNTYGIEGYNGWIKNVYKENKTLILSTHTLFTYKKYAYSRI